MTDGGMVISASAPQDPGEEARHESFTVDCTDGEEELCLEEILTLYSQPINEEQAWAVCYQCCRWLTQKHRRKETGASPPGRIAGPGDVRIRKDGTVKLFQPNNPDKHIPASSSIEVMLTFADLTLMAKFSAVLKHSEDLANYSFCGCDTTQADKSTSAPGAQTKKIKPRIQFSDSSGISRPAKEFL
ncbi:hypothetical protein DNTS_025445 [Danionella cerebrum]|uniref:KIND domain-containing protein n=1 Tax=Danionella cerebrum TaxID=2873325 RepID=A0A553Q338_9TELE|nr:hypothetical protein DNTS_025445 [Danionella translucida]